ncbi:PREDICTED: valacyclovir hydrolase [Dinoponera quadriceps]|uniref:Valacyclovir hydrolase n=1 Tax=Dinoponera quadriceps TaxID=609295 RepID=A0A6P3Y2N4_DINQU|nr:PREDICTED: valacyclovir hydrolase [Dinoponera quadriceps]XP_014484486.1 PREDICTED: valacyclovir hydrolase [Dinoponera quadriceps]XP_014484487.1 PREDICTED: valacyclovir hydrolase [Dinoponera quadriceps]XP_014484488.1 PREDICTED: valacyclovir hydrolase [Dinoponera quadriceps]
MMSNVCRTLRHSTKMLSKFVTSRNAFSWDQRLSSMASKVRQIEERKVNVNGMDINYARVGTGDHPVLLLPGALGTIWTDFKPQIENLDVDKLVIVAWDPPGYGKSRPPDRTFSDDMFQRDAICAHNLMKTLGYERFSLIGWSDGGITSLLLASMYPESIYKMVVIGANAYIQPDEVKLYENIRDINSWSKKMSTPMIQVYGKDYFKKIWSDWVDTMQRLYKKQNGDLCKQVLSKIKCPTLIVQGAKDVLVLPEHPKYLKQNIANSKMYIFEKGSHNLHLRYPDEFNKLVLNFLLEKSKI